MKFTNTYTTIGQMSPIHATAKATLFEFETNLENYGDVVVSIWLPNWSFIQDHKIGKILENGSKKYVDIDAQIIHDFSYRVFNKDLDLELNNLTLDDLTKLINGKEIKELSND